MPLSQSDPSLDYDGSWGDASANWPSILFASPESANAAYVIAWRYCKIPYGSYVLMGDQQLRLETEAYKTLVLAWLAAHGDKKMACHCGT